MDKITSALQSALAQLEQSKRRTELAPSKRKPETTDDPDPQAKRTARGLLRLEQALRAGEPPERNVRRGTYLDISV